MKNVCVTQADLFLLLSIIFHLFLCPFTKVEESFNMQAGHDLHHFNFITDLKSFDHLEFSGVVPRTFCGSIVVTLISLPLHLVNDIVVSNLNLTTANIASFIYRATLGVILWSSFCVFRKSLHMSKKFSPRTSLIFSTLLAMQFHIPFYASRSLPNTFALALVMVAYGFWFRNQPTKCLYCIGVASVLFRCDMLVLLAPMALQMLLCEPQQVPFRSTLFTGVGVCVITIIASCLIDSYFWSRPLWPEGEVLLFNTVENKSSEWGTHSWHWYFSSAMPKAMHTCTPLLFLGVLNPYNNSRDERAALWYFLAPVICFLGLYSFLPHKELRFVFPAIPLLTLAAARGMDSLLPAKWFNGGEETGVTGNSAVSDKETDNDTDTAKKSTVGKEETFYCRFHRVTAVLFLLGFVAVTLCTTGVFSIAAQYNYPGGEALLQLNSHLMKADKVSGGLQSNSDTAAEKYAVSETEIETESGGECTAERIVSIHIDAAAAMSGINRFGQLHHPQVLYSKDESDDLLLEQFDWLLTGDPSKENIARSFHVWAAVSSFDGFFVNRQVPSLQTVKSIVKDHCALRSGTEEDGALAEKTPVSLIVAPILKFVRCGCSLIKDLVKHLSPLQMRQKDSIFIMQRNAI